MAVHTRLRPDPVHLQNNHEPDPAAAQGCEGVICRPDGTPWAPPHDRPLPQVKTTDDILEAHRTPDLGELMGPRACLGCQDDPSHPNVEETARIRWRTDPRIDQQANPPTMIGQGCHEGQVLAGPFKGIQIRHVDLRTPEGCVQPLQQDQRIGARRQAALHRMVPFPVAAHAVDRHPLPDIDDRD